jgi:hypothetical protein
VDGVPKPNLVFSAAKPAAGLSTGPRGFVSVLSFHFGFCFRVSELVWALYLDAITWSGLPCKLFLLASKVSVG